MLVPVIVAGGSIHEVPYMRLHTNLRQVVASELHLPYLYLGLGI
jgi:hypothetical protein